MERYTPRVKGKLPGSPRSSPVRKPVGQPVEEGVRRRPGSRRIRLRELHQHLSLLHRIARGGQHAGHPGRAPCARSSFSIFMASTISTVSPSCTASPSPTATRTTSPGMGALRDATSPRPPGRRRKLPHPGRARIQDLGGKVRPSRSSSHTTRHGAPGEQREGPAVQEQGVAAGRGLAAASDASRARPSTTTRPSGPTSTTWVSPSRETTYRALPADPGPAKSPAPVEPGRHGGTRPGAPTPKGGGLRCGCAEPRGRSASRARGAPPRPPALRGRRPPGSASKSAGCSSRYAVDSRPARKSGSSMIRARRGVLVETPPIRSSPSARFILRTATRRSAPCAISLPRRGS